LSTHGSNPTIGFVHMSDLKFILLIEVLTQNSNTMELAKFLEKNQRLTFKLESSYWRWHHAKPWEKNKKEEEVRIQDSTKEKKKIFFFGTMPFSPLVFLAMWLYTWVFQKIHEKQICNLFWKKIHPRFWKKCQKGIYFSSYKVPKHSF
jgi:hypothetical protein